MNDTLKLRRWLVLGASAMALGAMAAPAMAADASAAAGAAAGADDQNTIDTLVVTAEKREQSVQDVPIAISAFGTKQRDLKGINTVQDMTNFTPGLVYSSTNDRASVRGVGRLTNIHSADAAVAIYVDGLYSTSTVFAGMPPLLVDRVEVLRGPQGTLYGRNSIGGIINIITQRPTSHWTGEVRAIGENYGYSDFQGTIAGPINDNLRFRLSGYKKDQRDGYFNNVNAGMPSEGSKRNEYYVELQLAANIGEHAEAWFKYDNLHWNNRGGPGARSGFTDGAYDTTSPGIGASNPLIYNAAYGYSNGIVANSLTQFNGGNVTTNPALTNPRDFNTNTPLSVKLQNANQFSFNFVYHFPTFDVKYLTNWQHYHYSLSGDYDNTNVNTYQVALDPNGYCANTAGCQPLTVHGNETYTYDEVPTWYSHEINLTSTTDGPLQWVMGAYYYHEHYTNPQAGLDPSQTQLLNPLNLADHTFTSTIANPTGLFNYTNYDMVTKSTGVFGQVDYKITDTLKVTGGLRYTRDTKYGTEYLRDVCFADSCLSSVYTQVAQVVPALGLLGPATAANLGSFLGQQFGVGSGGIDVTSSLLPCTTIAGTKGVTGTPVATAACAGKGGYTQAYIDPTTGMLTRSLGDSSSATTGTMRAEWTPDRDTMAYASYSRGYKAFGLYAGQLLAQPEAKPEAVDAYEIGLKKDFGHTLQVNLAAFYYAYHNLQAPVQITTVNGYSTEFVNVAESRSSGIEVDAVWQPIDHLQLSLDYSYNPTRITKSDMFADVNNNKNWAAAGSPALYYQPESVVGDSLPQAPKNKIALNGNYTFVLDAGKINVGANFIWRDKSYANIFTRSWNEAPSWDQVDLRGSWTPNNGKYQVILYVKNVGNTLGYDAAAVGSPRNIAYGNAANVYSLTPPRTYGIEVHYKFF